MGTVGTIIAALIGAVVTVGTSVYQSGQVNSAQDEARGLNRQALAEDKRRWAEDSRLARRQAALNEASVAESKREFDVTTAANKENTAWTKLQSRFDRLTGVMSQDQQLEDLYINRLKGLRG